MKASNKILLGIFLVPLLVLITINATLYAKYKSGHYISMARVEEDRYLRYPLKNINRISVYGLNNFRIVPADVAKLEIEKNENSHLRYTVSGDSLVIHGDSIIPRAAREDAVIRSYQMVKLYLPAANASITADNSDIYLAGAKDSTNARSYQFSLGHAANLQVEGNETDNETPIWFKDFSIQATRAGSIEFTERVHIAALNLLLLETAFTDNGASFGKLSIDADKASTLTLKGDNLQKLHPIH